MELTTKSKGCNFNKFDKCSLGGNIPEDCRNCTSFKSDTFDAGDLVKIISKTSRHRGAIATLLDSAKVDMVKNTSESRFLIRSLSISDMIQLKGIGNKYEKVR